MADSDDIDLNDDEVSDAGGPSKKRGGGIGNLLPNILRFVAIGIGAMIFIVTVSVITYNIMQKGGKSQTELYDPSGPYVPARPLYSYYEIPGSITTKTRDFPISATVTVDVVIGYDLGDQNASSELVNRRFELRDFLRRYFAGKFVEELTPEREEELKKEIREQMNQRILDTARVRDVFFNRLDVLSDAI